MSEAEWSKKIMPNIEDPVQEAVEGCAASLAKTFPEQKAAFLSVHFLCGIPETPGYIRRSAGRAVFCNIANWANAAVLTNPQKYTPELVHRRALLEHVRAFDRRHTILNLAARASNKKERDLVLEIGIAQDLPVEKSGLQVSTSDNGSILQFTVMLSPGSVELLAPPVVSQHYLEAAYRRAASPFLLEESEPEDFRNRFLRARAEIFGRLLAQNRPESLLDSMTDILDGECAEEKLWNLLNPIQSTLVYTHGLNRAGIKFAIACLRKKPATGLKMGTLDAKARPLALVFSSHFDLDAILAEVANKIGKDELKGTLSNYLQLSESTDPQLLAEQLRMRGSYIDEAMQPLLRVVENAIEPIVHVPAQKKRLAALSWWMCLLAQKLYGRIHEGEPLDFWFIAGERTEFADDARFRLDKLLQDGPEKDSLQAPLTGGKIDGDKLEAAVRYLEKEHFPWFHRGRHALFFDISDEQLRPIGLVEVTNSSWHQVLDESYKDAKEQHMRIPGCSIVYVDGETRDAGVLISNPLVTPAPRIRRVMRMHKGRWQVIGGDEREQQLLEKIKMAMNSDVERAREVAGICLRVADDLTIGGTLVFVENKDFSDGFLKLGESWTFGESFQDRIPLIAHDGATIVFPERVQDRVGRAQVDWQWRYRRILTPGKMDPAISEQLQMWSLNYIKGTPLNGVGTRRWSAALTALRLGVKLVVVISQDGGVTCWWTTWKNRKPSSLNYLNLPMGETSKHGTCDFNAVS